MRLDDLDIRMVTLETLLQILATAKATNEEDCLGPGQFNKILLHMSTHLDIFGFLVFF